MNDIFINNRWLKVYADLVNRGKTRQQPLKYGIEIHHIIPKSFWSTSSTSGWIEGDPDTSDNLTVLLYREHFLAHRLLIRITEGLAKTKMVDALWQMIHSAKDDIKINSKVYSELRAQHSIAQSERLKQLWQDPVYRENQSRVQSEAQRKVHQRPGHAEIHRLATIKSMARPEVKAKQAASLSVSSKEVWSRPGFRESMSAARTGEKNPRADKTVYMWIHENGDTEVLTRVDMRAKYKKSFDKLFCRNPKQKVHGWRVNNLTPIHQSDTI